MINKNATRKTLGRTRLEKKHYSPHERELFYVQSSDQTGAYRIFAIHKDTVLTGRNVGIDIYKKTDARNPIAEFPGWRRIL